MHKESPQAFDWSKLGQREVSSFIGQELLFDYLTQTLDSERQKAVEKFVAGSKLAQDDMAKILNGLQYAERLSETKVSQKVIDRINEPSTYLAVLLKKTNFQKWPGSIKWALEALIVISIVGVFTLIIPWDKVSKFNPFPQSRETVLAEVSRQTQIGDPQKLKEVEAAEPPQFVDEVKTVVAKEPQKSTTAPETVASNPPVAVAASADANTVKESKKPGEGVLFRGAINVTNLDTVGPKIRDKIMDMGGRKAGEVALGWKKTPKSSYFHFTVPEAKYQELIDFLGTYGKLKISKEKHPRIMPDGIIRLIITVDEAGP